MDTSKLIYRAYASHDLDEIEKVFKERTGSDPTAFVIRPNWVVSGSKENYSKIVISRTAACNCVMVSLKLTKEELENIYSSFAEYHQQNEVEIVDDPELAASWDDDSIRYCRYCGQVFSIKGTSDFSLICDKPECSAREDNRIKELEKLKVSSNHKAQEVKPLPEDKAELVKEIITDDQYSDTVAGWVYLIAADNDLCKIGHTDDVYKRFSNLVAMNAAGLALRHSIYSMNRMRAEKYLHDTFSNKRSHGEWFRLTNEDIEWIRGIPDRGLDAF